MLAKLYFIKVVIDKYALVINWYNKLGEFLEINLMAEPLIKKLCASRVRQRWRK